MADLLIQGKGIDDAEHSPVPAATVLLVVALVFAFLTTGAVGALAILTRRQAAAHAEFTRQVQDKELELRSELLGQITALDNRLKNIRTLLAQHPFNSNILAVVERASHPQVHFRSFNFTTQSRKLDMDGEAPAYRIVTRQLELLERDPAIERVEFGGLGTSAENRVAFKVSLVFKPDILRLAP